MFQHFGMYGNNGTGKTQLMKQLAYYAKVNGYCCVMNCAKDGEFIQEFFEPERGDIILNPKDVRCPYWLNWKEFRDEAEARSWARSLFPAHPNNPQAEFWDDYARNLVSFLVSSARTPLDCHALAKILISEDEIARRVNGTEFGQLFDAEGGGSSNMRTSVIQTVNQIGYALRMMPRRDEATHEFCIREWAEHRKGWIFLSSTELTSESVLPLQSAWIDMILNQLLSGGEQANRVILILDELDSLKQLPKLQRAMTKLRSSGNIIAIGVHDVSQLEDRYGKQADTIFAEAGTKFILRTAGDKSSKRLEQLIGEEEVRLVRQSRTAGIMGGNERDTYSGPEEVSKPLIKASEIQGLPDLTGYMIQAPTDNYIGLNVVRFKVPYKPLVKRHPGIIPRTVTRDIDLSDEPDDLFEDDDSDNSPAPWDLVRA